MNTTHKNPILEVHIEYAPITGRGLYYTFTRADGSRRCYPYKWRYFDKIDRLTYDWPTWYTATSQTIDRP